MYKSMLKTLFYYTPTQKFTVLGIRSLHSSAFLCSTRHSTDLDISRGVKRSVRRSSEFDGPNHHDAVEQRLRSKQSYRVRNKTIMYSPPENLHDVIKSVAISELKDAPDWSTASLDNNLIKYNILTKLAKMLNYTVPNSYLWEMKTMKDVISFYEQAMNQQPALESMSKQDIPPNLNIRTEYLRFDPVTDTFFGGVTAFPKSDTIISGVKPKKLYKGHKAKKEPYDYIKFD